jgi:hypothetical protein
MTRTYVALLDGGRRQETVRVTPIGAGVYDVEVGGAVQRVDVARHDPGTMSLLVDGRSYSVELDERRTEARVRVGDSSHAIEILDERRMRLRPPAR